MEYLIVVDAPAFRISGSSFATESAFAGHLRSLASQLAPAFDRLRLAAPAMPRARYEADKAHLVEVHEHEGISFIPMQELGASFFDYVRRAPSAWRTLWESVRHSDVVHSGLSSDLARPLGFVATLAAVVQEKPATFVVDIDFRESARMNYRTKRWSLKSYLLCRHVYDPLRVAQIRFAIRHCSLVLLKGRRMVDAFGGGHPHVKDFLDAAHSREHVIGVADIRAREARLDRRDEPLRLVYFGRLVRYKGVDRAIVALSMVRRYSGRDFTLDVVGAGEEEPHLRRLAESLGLATRVAFRGAIPYGAGLFDALGRADLALATPLAEDTPRSAIDAFAAGVPIVAFDLSYYRDLARSGAVLVAPWLDVRAIADRVLELDEDRDRVKTMIRSGVEFARTNTQEIWLERRVAWTAQLCRPGRDVGLGGGPDAFSNACSAVARVRRTRAPTGASTVPRRSGAPSPARGRRSG